MGQEVLVAGICGSLREGSHTRKALRVALKAAEEAGARTVFFDLAEKPLPFSGGPSTDQEKEHAEEWSRLVKEADGLILATPEYHGSFSGVLKNALDLVSFDEMEETVCGLVSVLGGGAQSNALNHLRLVCRQVHAWVIPHQAAIGASYKAFDEDGNLVDPKLCERVQRVGRDVVKYARMFRSSKEE